MKNKKSQTYYRLSRSTGEYHPIHIDIVEDGYSYNQFGPCGVELSFQWQSHKGSNHWYGASVKIDTKSISGIKRCYQLLSSLCGDSNALGTPEQVIAALEAKKIKQGVYDNRLSEFVSVENVAPVDHVRWLAGNGKGGWITSIVCPRDEQEALKLLARALSNYSLESYEQWVLAGKPTKIDDLSCAPNTFPIDLTPL